jgi:putative copper resistance protein D
MAYRLSVWIHLVAACAWVGGILFFALVLVPLVRRGDPARAGALVRDVGLRFRPVGWGALAILVLTGITNLIGRMPAGDLATPAFWLSPFGRTLLVKLGLVIAVVAVTIVHDLVGPRATAAATAKPGSVEALRLRRLASVLGRIDAVLALLILLVAVMLVRGWP